ncbi:sodium/calcium exchanger NCL2-like [Olea europaea var. sylvestris]|uniref:sodium/calcium exchanger NCL2-like n=2 Tax=Olea europaea var. sylvestris TaxID=158386 RepID=UPI000C1D385F|nr:sodium/calcium exchanger NCL2-like [Olea europaea var. sylvestris]
MKSLYLAIFLLFILSPAGVRCRPLRDGSSLVSDGVNDRSEEEDSSFIRLKSMDYGAEEGEDCKQMYGFLPCSKSSLGHLFLIIVYEYLLFHGESYVASGGERIFKILGPGVFGASIFQVIGSLPEALILLASGLLNGKETAQECVITGVGLLAGSTILLLTLVWGTCVILGGHHYSNQSGPNSSYHKEQNHVEKLLSKSNGYGVVTDLETCHTAWIMLGSVIPLIMIQIPRIFNLPYLGERIVILTTLLVSVIFLLCYFFYQFFEPWIQKRHLSYIKHEHLVLDVLKHVQNRTMGSLLTDNGSPNVSVIRRLFYETDCDGDKFISFPELQEFLQEIRSENILLDNDNETTEMMKEFDNDNDNKITIDEFVNGMKKWLDEAKGTLNKRYHSIKSMKGLYQVLKPWIEKKRAERETMRILIPKLLEHLQSIAYGGLLTEDGAPDISAIKRLFKEIDLDKDDTISYHELRKLMTNMRSGILPYDADAAASKIMKELDMSGDHLIDEEEFVTGLSKWLKTTSNPYASSEKSEEDDYKETWEQTDKLIEDKFTDKSPLAWTKAITLLVLGIVILGLLAEPLIDSVRNLSKTASVSSFHIAFIFVPLATNARITISLITEARRKKPKLSSLTFSEIYGTVFMNNILGLAVLLSLIYFRGLTWNFSAEVLMVLVVSVIMGCLASFRKVFPVWTSFLAYLLYPMSLVLVYVLGHFK